MTEIKDDTIRLVREIQRFMNANPSVSMSFIGRCALADPNIIRDVVAYRRNPNRASIDTVLDWMKRYEAGDVLLDKHKVGRSTGPRDRGSIKRREGEPDRPIKQHRVGIWCSQCDALVAHDKPKTCKSSFCPLKK